jgi:hypothetical protein
MEFMFDNCRFPGTKQHLRASVILVEFGTATQLQAGI